MQSMFSQSTRRVPWAASPNPILSSFSSTTQRAAASHALSSRCHQRRYSSSKPSSPADGSKGVAEGTVSSTPAQAGSEGEKKASRTSKRKAKDVAASCTVKGRDDALKNLPRVPGTHHLSANQIAASDFFSLHRPISLTISFPKAVSEDAFAAIFTPRTRANKSAEVIGQLSSTLHALESATTGMRQLNLGSEQQQWNTEKDAANSTHLDAAPGGSGMDFPQHILASGSYQPFNPPPVPTPSNSAESLAVEAEVASMQEREKVYYTSLLTIEQSYDEDGEVRLQLTNSTPIQERTVPVRFSERMQQRQLQYRERVEENGMWAISVKRQRKLKMKKHKYKKLMRRTRNERRKLDRL